MTAAKPLPAINPCPFCGGKNPDPSAIGEATTWIICSKCKAFGPTRKTIKGAIVAWNRRKEPK